MSRGSDKIAQVRQRTGRAGTADTLQLENALEKKDQEINVLRLATRRLEDELQTLTQRLKEELAERDASIGRLKKSLEDRMSVIEGTTWSGRLTTKYLTVCERLRAEPDVGVLFALSTGSRTITSDKMTENVREREERRSCDGAAAGMYAVGRGVEASGEEGGGGGR